MNTLSISVIIPTYNAIHYLPKLLNSLIEQTVDFEIIVIDSSSRDGTLDTANEFASKVIIIPQSEFDHGGTRAKAAKEARGDILVFLTQDALPFNINAVKNLIEPLKDKDVVASYGRQLANGNATLFAKHLREYNYPQESYIRSFKDSKKYGLKTAFLSDSFAAYRKDAILDVGSFKEGTIFGEDMHLVARLLINGKKVAYCSDAMVYHSHNYSVKEEFMRYFDTGVFHSNEAWLIEKFGKAEGEGLRYVKSEFKSILKEGDILKIPEFLIRNIAKIVGYKLGKNYKKFPKNIAKSLSMHQSWWDRWA